MEYLRRRKHAFLGVDKRLGKSWLATYWALHHQFPRTLIAAPLSAIPDWVRGLDGDGEIAWDMTVDRNFREWLRYGDKLPGRFFLCNHHGLFLGKGVRCRCQECGGQDLCCKVCGGTGRVTRSEPLPNVLAVYPWPAVIFDETTLLRSPSSQINTVSQICLGSVPNRLGLSGEYAPESPLDVFEQMKWCFGDFMGHTNFYKWRNEFFEQDRYEWVPKMGVRSEIRNHVAQRGFLMRRSDAGMMEHVEYERRYCDLPQKIKRLYDHAEAWFEIPGDGKDQKTIYTKYLIAVRHWLCRLAGGYLPERPDLHSDHKLKLLWEVVQERPHEPLVISFRHNAELERADAFLRAKKETTMVLRGAQSTEERGRHYEAFRAGTARLCLKQAKVHFGADLSTADTMIRYSLPDKYEDLSQDRDRIVHPTKKRPLLYIDLIARDTVDEDLVSASRLKGIDARYFMQKVEGLFLVRSQMKRGAHGGTRRTESFVC